MADLGMDADRRTGPSAASSAVDVFGRILLAAIFISSGIGKFLGWPGVVGSIAGKGLPAPQLLGALVIAVELIGSFALITGFGLRWGALALAGFTLVAGVIYHNFWAVDAAQYTNQFNHFMKNIAIVGALLIVAARRARSENEGRLHTSLR